MKYLADIQINNIIGTINSPSNADIYKDPVNVGLGKIISTGIQLFFFLAGLAALVYLLWGAFDWIISNGEKEKLQKAQNKIQSAVIGLVLMVIVVTVLATLEQVVLKGTFCAGLTCGINLPTVAGP